MYIINVYIIAYIYITKTNCKTKIFTFKSLLLSVMLYVAEAVLLVDIKKINVCFRDGFLAENNKKIMTQKN